ncbi:MAG: hypothetical protein EYC70_02510 [Planctomycetota bacterium]|nr:MAG: hypothetical protein EYC70_02510 [Planctomycetota bacterium]
MRPLLVLTAALLTAASAAAQAEYMMYGGTPSTTDWEIRRTFDVDGDQLFLTPGERIAFAADGATQVTFVNDLRYEELQGVPSVFGAGGDDVILRLVDLDGDGVASGPTEVLVFADTRASFGVANTSPDGVDFSPNTLALYVTDDIWAGTPQLGNGISIYRDMNNDGDALDGGEFFQFVNGQGTITVQGSGGPVVIDSGDFEAVMVDSNEVAVAWAQQDLVLYAFADFNGDRDAMDAGEAWNFLNLVGDKPGLDLNADVAAGALPNPSCPSTGGAGLFADLGAISVDHGTGPGGLDVYWIASMASNSSCASGAGFVYRGVDLNQDGDLNDAGEVKLWLDGANNAFMLYPVTSIYDAYSHNGGVSILQGNGPQGTQYIQDSVYFLRDLNGDGDAEDFDEQVLRYAWDPDGAFTVSLAVVPAGAFNEPSVPSFTIFGTPGSTSIGGQPRIGYNGLPGLGQSFDVTLTGALPGRTVISIFGASNTQWNRPPLFNLPLDLTFFGMPGNTLYVSVNQQVFTRGDTQGNASATWSVPNDPNLDGRHIYFQWYVTDPFINPRGAVTSDALDGVIH